MNYIFDAHTNIIISERKRTQTEEKEEFKKKKKKQKKTEDINIISYHIFITFI